MTNVVFLCVHGQSFSPHHTLILSAETGKKSLFHTGWNRSCNPLNKYHKILFLLLFFCIPVFSGIAFPTMSCAQVIDSIDAQKRGSSEAEVVIRFAMQVQYLRHAPRDVGSSVRIYVQLTGSALQPSDLIPQTMRLPKKDFLPQTSVSFPESGNSVLVNFDQMVRFSVSPGPDGRSIHLLVSAISGK
ncbi:MAG: hypothetical protein ABL891_13980 [Burkholderiales bacterium]